MALIKRDRENFWILNWLDEYMTGHKGFICGGCFKNIFNKEKVKDLDIFFENESDFDDAVQYFDSQTRRTYKFLWRNREDHSRYVP